MAEEEAVSMAEPSAAPVLAALGVPEDLPPTPTPEEPHKATVSELLAKYPSSPSPSSSKEEQQTVTVGSENPKPVDSHKIPQSTVSFKEESNIVSDLSDSEKKALDELKNLVEVALKNRDFSPPKPPPPPPAASTTTTTQEVQQQTQENPPLSEEKIASQSLESTGESVVSSEEVATKTEETPVAEQTKEEIGAAEEVFIWGIPFLKDDRSDVILLKFLRAREFKVREAFTMLTNTIKWRRDFEIDALVEEDLGDDLEKVVFTHGVDREGHPVCYNVYGEFQNKELYQKTFSDGQKRLKFLRWRIQFLEKGIRKLDFSPGGISTIFQVNDLKNSPGPGKRELRIATKQALHLLQDNYPEFVAKQVFINVPWWYLAFYAIISPFLTDRTKSKFVFSGPSRTADTLFKYIPPEQVPVQYGGLSVDYCDCNPDFSTADPATELTVKPATKQTVEIFTSEKCFLVWELRVVGWEVSYKAEYVPSSEHGYMVIIQKPKKMAPTDEPIISGSFKIDEPGTVMLTVDNPTSKKKKLLYRFKVKTF
ncbi:CRAL-TRIO lipid binding domain [Dillenia turbinata]|uniref:CRAL-TRIO lipid binding domain n=1 Tax=Dillenia turbinata TaxID=194707 RepID=A0AAN8ZHA3_9MAGN